MNAAWGATARGSRLFELEGLELLQCGCVAAAYRAPQWDVSLVSLEVKGPHCILPGHGPGLVLQLGDGLDMEGAEEEV